MPNVINHGVGSVGAGSGHAGHDTLADPVDRPLGTVTAVEFDPLRRVYAQNADLTMRGTSPTIQRAATLMLPTQSIAAVADSGIPLEPIRRALPENRARAVENALRTAWSELLSAGLLEIVSIELEPNVGAYWSGAWVATVRDLTTGAQATLTGS